MSEIDPFYANILVRCPDEAQQHQPAQPVHEFMANEEVSDGVKEVVAQCIEKAGVLVDKGLMDKEEAIDTTLGMALVKDEEGNIMRSPEPDAPFELADPEESKKKDLSRTPRPA